MISYIRVLLFLTISFLYISCDNSAKQKTSDSKGKKTYLKYAKGFTITNYNSYKALEIKDPWPDADNSFRYILSDNEYISNINSDENLDGIVQNQVNKIVVTSTTHIPALELLGVEQALVGFPGTHYISSERTRKRIDSGLVRELGKNESINIEVLLELQPDLVIGFGIDGNNKSFETIRKSNIPVIYNGDWVESSPLAKAEWIKFFGVLFNKEKEADSIFNNIESSYLEAKQLVSTSANKPTVISGAMHKDVWYAPSNKSAEGQFLVDANVDYLWKNSNSNGSLTLSFETVFSKGKDADIWLNPSHYKSLEELKQANTHYTKFDAYKDKKVFSFANTVGNTGGVLYYELGLSRPDLVLKDIIKICHPDLLNNYEPFFFKPLQ